MNNVNSATPRMVDKTALPMFVIDVTPSRIDLNRLVDILVSLQDTYCCDCIATGSCNSEKLGIYLLYVWYDNPNFDYPDEFYRTRDFVCFLQRHGVDVREEDVSVSFSQRRSEQKPSEETPFPNCDEDDMPVVGKEGADHHIRDDVQHQSNESLRKETQHG